MRKNTAHIKSTCRFLRNTTLLLGLLSFCYVPVRAASEPDLDSLRDVLLKSKTDEKQLAEFVFTATNQMLLQHKEARLQICYWALRHARHKKLYNTAANAMFGIAKVFADNDDFVNATHWCIQAITYCDKHHIESIKADIMQLLGYVYYFNKQYARAEEFYKKSIPLAEKYKDSTMLFNAYAGLAVMYLTDGSVKTWGNRPAYNYLAQARVYLRPKKRKDDVIYYYNTFSSMLTEIGEYDSALIYLNTAKQYIDSSELKDYYSTFHLHLGRIYQGKKNTAGAEKSYRTGLLYCQQEGISLWEAQHLLALSQLFEKTGRYREAYDCYRQSTAISDSIVNAKNFAKAADIENKYEREKKNLEITRLHKDNEIKQLKIDKETAQRKKLSLLTILLSITAAVLIVWVLLQIKNTRRRKQSYLLLQQKNIEIQHQSEKLAKQSKLIGKFQGQVSPAFIFNAVHFVKDFIEKDLKEGSVIQLQGFAKLMRQTLNHAELEWVGLEQELDYINNYVSFEKERLRQSFTFTLHTPDYSDELMLPPMFIQPFIEKGIQRISDESSHITLSISVSTFLNITLTLNDEVMNTDKLIRENENLVYVVQSRLALLFESEGLPYSEEYFRIISSATTGTQIHIVLPLKYKY